MGQGSSRHLAKYVVLFRKGFAQNLQYSASHLLNTVASAAFGLVYIYLWKAVAPIEGFAGYTSAALTSYIVINQVTLWFSQFAIRTHVRLRDAVRSGDIASELQRPMDLFAYRISFDLGSQVYSLLFRGIPVGLMLARFLTGITREPAALLWGAISLAFSGYIGIAIAYMVGISAFWTTSTRTAWWVATTLSLSLGGASMPLEILPEAIRRVVTWTPFPYLSYYTARILLELSGPGSLLGSGLWALILTYLAGKLTASARSKLEVQGG